MTLPSSKVFSSLSGSERSAPVVDTGIWLGLWSTHALRVVTVAITTMIAMVALRMTNTGLILVPEQISREFVARETPHSGNLRRRDPRARIRVTNNRSQFARLYVQHGGDVMKGHHRRVPGKQIGGPSTFARSIHTEMIAGLGVILYTLTLFCVQGV